LIGWLRNRPVSARELDRLEEKQRGLARASEQWRTLLREMENSGESGDPRYESYFRAYVETREQQKQADLELFNRRQGLNT